MTVLAPPRPDAQLQPAPPNAGRAPNAARALGSGALASAAAAWMASGLFLGVAARAIALGGVVLGIGMVALSLRTRRQALVQYLVLPVAALIGALLVLPDTSSTQSLQSLIAEAVREGGLAQPPVPLDPGWRFLLLVVTAVLSSASASFALAIRPAMGITLALPVVIAAGVVQPEGSEVAGAAVALGLILAALTVSSGEELGVSTKGLEVRRLARGGAGVLGLAIAMVALSRAGFLFPDTTSERIVPAQRPPVAGPQADRVLFTVDADTAGPWRLGVLDIYDGLGWLLPPLDPARMQDIPSSGDVAGEPAGAAALRATFTIADMPGRVLPGLAEPFSVTGLQQRAQIDPRTQTIRLPEGRAEEGIAYTVTAPGPPSGRALSEAPPPGEELAPFLEAPQPPNEVVALIADAPENPWDRLVYLRARLFERVIAAGAGDPVDVPPARATELLAGAEATPFEITATEALLARWAGVPSRIGFGFFGGEATDEGPFEIRPRHGATWLEIAFEGHGWVPIVGVPPRARASLSPEQQREDLNVTATDELALIVHVPIQLQTVRLLVVTVRYWLTVIVPPLLGLMLAWWALPGLLKLVRERRRRRWARGARERILVAYARFRDAATDLGIGEPTATPLGFVKILEHDGEHVELAWLVSRALWGDLRRALDHVEAEADAEDAERMARSLTRRLRRAHPPLGRVLAFGARASLRSPYTSEVPNVHWPRSVRALLPRARRAHLATGLIVLALASVACARTVQVGVGTPGALPARAVPDRIGALRVTREPVAEEAFKAAGDASLIHQGRIYTLRHERTVEGYIEVASFRAGVDALERDVRDAILRSIGAGTFRLQRIGEERAWVQELPEQRMLLTFAPNGDSMTLLVVRRAFTDAEDTFVALVRHQRGEPATGRAPDPPPAYDPRTGMSR